MKRIIFITMMVVVSIHTTAQDIDSTIVKGYDWTPVIDAIIWHESRGNPNASCGPYLGVLQIAAILVRECNNILKSRGVKKRFTLNDRRSKERSIEMFYVIMSKYNKENDVDKACRIWHGGARYTKKSTQKFVNEIHVIMKQQQKKKYEEKE